MPERQTHRGYEVRLYGVPAGWMAVCDLPRLGTQWHYEADKEAALRAACDRIDTFCLTASDDHA
jgi:hypothetical protein